ncbi:uncharacterized protein LOC135975433 [Chrysemys picta bellii]|uniref:uncharacterized protein LOC135975433 n=1 Tax=Chrysemys picta bellii TaxID=8478 RepID=UPI0032B2012A
MELTFLLPVLASLQIFPSLVSPTAPLSAPTLSLHPPHPEFFEGERLTLRCSAPRAAEPTGYRFFDQSGERLFETPPDLYREGQLHLTAQLATTGAYSCAYWTGASGQETPSEKSQPVSVQVKDAPAAPSLSLNPRSRVYHAGDSVGLVCSAPPSVDRVKGFQYFGDRIAVLALASSKKSYTYNLNITGPTNVPARRSEPVVISMRGSWSRELAVGGSFFTLNSLIFLVTYFLMKREAYTRLIESKARSSGEVMREGMRMEGRVFKVTRLKGPIMGGEIIPGLELRPTPDTAAFQIALGSVLDGFEEQWALSGVLCSVSPSGTLVLNL